MCEAEEALYPLYQLYHCLDVQLFFSYLWGDKKEDCMLEYSYSTKDIRLILPLLKEHFAFDYVEISHELASVVNTHMEKKETESRITRRI